MNNHVWFSHGVAVVGRTATPLTTKTIRTNGSAIVLEADPRNTVPVYIGGPGVTADDNQWTGGFPLRPGRILEIPALSPGSLSLVATAENQKVHWFASAAPLTSTAVHG